jgi:hypothetical protein
VLLLPMEASGKVEVQLNSATQKTQLNIMFVTLKLICVSNVFFHAEFKSVIRCALLPTIFVWKRLLKCNYSKFSFCLSCYQHILNIAEVIYYILNIKWA